MPKITITIEDLPDGAVFLSGTPTLPDLHARCAHPEKLSAAEGYALTAWIALRQCAEQAARDSGGTLEEWIDESKH